MAHQARPSPRKCRELLQSRPKDEFPLIRSPARVYTLFSWAFQWGIVEKIENFKLIYTKNLRSKYSILSTILFNLD